MAATTLTLPACRHQDEDDEDDEARPGVEEQAATPSVERPVHRPRELPAGLAAEPAAEHPADEGSEDPAVPDLVVVVVDGEPDPEDQRPHRARDDDDVDRVGDGAGGVLRQERRSGPRREHERPERGERAHEEERAEDVEEQQGVVELHDARA
jgi:hypothetical protein